MMSATTSIWTWVAACGAVAVAVWSLKSRRKRIARFSEREALSLDTIFQQHFAPLNFPKDLVVELWNEVAEPLGVSPGKLRTTDRFDAELSPVEEWDDDIVEVQWAAERRLRKTGSKADLSQIQTLKDYVEFFCKLQEQQPAAGQTPRVRPRTREARSE
jgi:hypothetical protein